jgi:tetratricopeptide (TPR) repeat protein
VRKLLEAVFRTSSDLDAFVLDHFPRVSKQFATGMSWTMRVNLLFDSIEPTEVMEQLRSSYPNEMEQALSKLGGSAAPAGVRPVVAGYLPIAPKTTWVERPEQVKVLHLLDDARTGRAPAKVHVHGIGGIGKTALAAQVAAAQRSYFADQMVQVRLAKRALDEVLSDLLEAVTGNRPQEGTEGQWARQIRGRLQERQPVLLILDDLRRSDEPWCDESVLDCLLDAVLPANVLITSRSRIAPAGYAAVEVTSLPQTLAVELITRLCEQKELAITGDESEELAALLGGHPFSIDRAVDLMQSDQLSASSLVLRMQSDGRDPEQLLAKLLEWSYDALDGQARLVLVTMGQLAEAPVPESLLDGLLPQVNRAAAVTRLIRSNLVQRSERSPGVFTYQLHTLLWEWAETLGNKKHFDAVTSIRQRIDESLRSHDPRIAPLLLDHILNAQKIAEQRERPEVVIELALDFDQSLAMFGHWRVRRELLERAIAAARNDTDQGKIADLLHRRGVVRGLQGDYEGARSDYSECLSIRQALKDLLGVAWELNNLGELERLQGAYESARKYLADSLARMKSLDHRQGIATVQGNLGNVLREQGDFDGARKLLEGSLAMSRDIGNQSGAAFVLSKLGIVARRQGRMDEARKLHKESLAISRALGDRSGIAWTLNSLGALARVLGQLAQSRTYYEESLAIGSEMGDRVSIASALMNLGTLDQQQGKYADAQERYQQSLALMRELGDRTGIASCLQGLGVIARALGRYDVARKLYEEGLDIVNALGNRDSAAMLLSNLGNVAQSECDWERASRCYGESLVIRQEQGDRAGIARVRNNLGELARAQGDLVTARQHYEECLIIRRELEDRAGMATTLLNLGGLSRQQDDLESAENLLREAVQHAEALSSTNKTLARIQLELGRLATIKGRQADSIRFVDIAITMLEALGDPLLPEAKRLRSELDGKPDDSQPSSSEEKAEAALLSTDT